MKWRTRPASHKIKRIIAMTTSKLSILTSFYLLAPAAAYRTAEPQRASLPAEVCDKGHYANDDEINTNQIVEYLGKNQNDNAENEACYPHQ